MVGYPIGFAASQSLPQSDELVPLGGIISFAGAVLSIPAGWQLCDGTNGTPDLRNKFVPGAGDTYAVDETGGTVDHANSMFDIFHEHGPGAVIDTTNTGIGEAWDGTEPSAAGFAVIAVTPSDNVPPFYALAYIQRMV